MKNNEKKGLLILVGVAILIVLVIWLFTRPKNNDNKGTTQNPASSESSASQGEFTKVEEDGTIVNTSEKLNEDRTEDIGFSVTNISFEESNGRTVLKARVTNATEKAQDSFFGNIVLFDKAGNEIGRIPVSIPKTQQGETIEVKASITESYANAYDFKLEK